MGALLLLALALLWLLRGPDSLHVQLRRIFEFATVKRYVEPATLHLLGLLAIPLLAMPLLVFLAAGGFLRRRPRWTISSVLAASAAAILWWGTSPAAVQGLAGRAINSIQGATMLTALAVFPLFCGAAAGLQRLRRAARRRSGRLLLWLCVMVLLVADFCGPARRAVDRVGEPSVHACAARTYENERECAQVLLTDLSVRGFAEPTRCALPSVFVPRRSRPFVTTNSRYTLRKSHDAGLTTAGSDVQYR